MGITFYSEELCNGCGLCIEECPVDVYVEDPETGKAKIAYLEDCWDCLLCELICPTEAIKVSPAATRRLREPYATAAI